MHTNDGGSENFRSDNRNPNPSRDRSADNPGYEVQDVNVSGLLTFLVGLSGFILIFFLFCFVMGKAINTGIAREDGKRDKWHQIVTVASQQEKNKGSGFTSNTALEQQQYAAMTKLFPTPRLQTDDGNQDTADMHAREDLLLNYYSTGSGLPAGKVRIPIDQAMEMIVKQGLPQPASGLEHSETQMAGDAEPVVAQPLTTGFARTGYELDQMAAREQRLEFNQAEAKR